MEWNKMKPIGILALTLLVLCVHIRAKCDTDSLLGCLRDFTNDVGGLTEGDAQAACIMLKTFKTCFRPYIQKCSASVLKTINTPLNEFNERYNCLQSSTVKAPSTAGITREKPFSTCVSYESRCFDTFIQNEANVQNDEVKACRLIVTFNVCFEQAKPHCSIAEQETVEKRMNQFKQRYACKENAGAVTFPQFSVIVIATIFVLGFY